MFSPDAATTGHVSVQHQSMRIRDSWLQVVMTNSLTKAQVTGDQSCWLAEICDHSLLLKTWSWSYMDTLAHVEGKEVSPAVLTFLTGFRPAQTSQRADCQQLIPEQHMLL